MNTNKHEFGKSGEIIKGEFTGEQKHDGAAIN